MIDLWVELTSGYSIVPEVVVAAIRNLDPLSARVIFVHELTRIGIVVSVQESDGQYCFFEERILLFRGLSNDFFCNTFGSLIASSTIHMRR
jgi:hypothetical protein